MEWKRRKIIQDSHCGWKSIHSGRNSWQGCFVSALCWCRCLLSCMVPGCWRRGKRRWSCLFPRCQKMWNSKRLGKVLIWEKWIFQKHWKRCVPFWKAARMELWRVPISFLIFQQWQEKILQRGLVLRLPRVTVQERQRRVLQNLALIALKQNPQGRKRLRLGLFSGKACLNMTVNQKAFMYSALRCQKITNCLGRQNFQRLLWKLRKQKNQKAPKGMMG